MREAIQSLCWKNFKKRAALSLKVQTQKTLGSLHKDKWLVASQSVDLWSLRMIACGACLLPETSLVTSTRTSMPSLLETCGLIKRQSGSIYCRLYYKSAHSFLAVLKLMDILCGHNITTIFLCDSRLLFSSVFRPFRCLLGNNSRDDSPVLKMQHK